MKRAGLYVRVSTQEQKNRGMSVDSQIDALTDFCKQNDYSYAIYNDAGFSARKRFTKRPALLQLLNDIQNGLIDIVLFTKLDRWFRSVADYYEVQAILDAQKVPWRAIWEDYSTETSSDVFKVNIMLSIAQAEADRTSERIKAVNEFQRANGKITYGKAPTGYKMAKGKLIIDRGKKKAVSAMFRKFLLTCNTRDAQNELKKHGVTISYETVQRMLRNPTYYGNAYDIQKVDAYISKEEWDFIQNVLDNRKTRRSTTPKKVYLFGGLIRCKECGRLYHSQTRSMKSGQKKYYYKYYKCGGAKNGFCENGVSISENKLEKHLLNVIEPLIIKHNATIEPIEVNDYEENRKRLEKQIKRIGDRYEFGEIERSEYIQKVNALKRQIAELKQPERKEKTLPDDWQDIYADLDDNHKKAFWNQILNCIRIKGNDIDVEF